MDGNKCRWLYQHCFTIIQQLFYLSFVTYDCSYTWLLHDPHWWKKTRKIYENQVLIFCDENYDNITHIHWVFVLQILILSFLISRVYLEIVDSINFSDPIFSICIYIESRSRVKRPEKVPTQVLNTLSTSFQCTSQHFLP